MEQQPGPVNWTPQNLALLPGMVCLWTRVAFTHGAQAVWHFRWRKVPFAQEQRHTGLLHADNLPTNFIAEAKQVSDELAKFADVKQAKANIAIMFDYDVDAIWKIQPRGKGLSYFGLISDIYFHLRRLGLPNDLLPPETRDFKHYKLIFAFGMIHNSDDLKEALTHCGARVLLGPRSAAGEQNMAILNPLLPDLKELHASVFGMKAMLPGILTPLVAGGAVKDYFKHIEGRAGDVSTTFVSESVAKNNDKVTYLVAWLDDDGLERLLKLICKKEKIEISQMPYVVGRRQAEDKEFW